MRHGNGASMTDCFWNSAGGDFASESATATVDTPNAYEGQPQQPEIETSRHGWIHQRRILAGWWSDRSRQVTSSRLPVGSRTMSHCDQHLEISYEAIIADHCRPAVQ